GRREMARRILETAQRHQIPIHHDPALAERLAQLELESLIPPELYQVVAELLVFVHRLDEQWQVRHRGGF
ncbi:MAG: EscU/YscU/HrcU family type III secretion system export apparatus switch protein, partial [Syntrophomonadaceae bacterium]|nr:EscU/YscU/HrcU family type III secretion system export apparatus switch protein [Syntrophomonadaceae bacterium]